MVRHARFIALFAALTSGCAAPVFSRREATIDTDPQQMCAKIADEATRRGLHTEPRGICATVSVAPGTGINFRLVTPGPRPRLRIEGYAATQSGADANLATGEMIVATVEGTALNGPVVQGRVAVVVPGDSVDGPFRVALTEIVVSTASDVPGVTVVTPSEINSILGFERQQQLMGCDENLACTAEMAGALGVDALLIAAAGKIGNTRVLSFKMADVSASAIVSRKTIKVQDESVELIPQAEKAVRQSIVEWMASRRHDTEATQER